MNRSAVCGVSKKTVETIHKEIEREVSQLLRVIFNAHDKTGRYDMEATESAVRSAMQ